MPELDFRDVIAGPLRVVLEYRRTPEDEGPTVRVFGIVGEAEKQVLRFDCFQLDPHYHYDPDGADEVHHMRDEGIEDPAEWTLHRLERDLGEMIRRAGFGSLADRVNRNQIEENLPEIREILLAPALS